MVEAAPPPPHLLEAEHAVLGALLLAPALFYDIADALAPADFYRAAHGTIYAVITELVTSGAAVDTLTVRTRLQARGQLDDIGGPAMLAALTDGVPTSTNITAYARIVREDALLRGVLAVATRMQSEAQRPEAEARVVLDRAQAAILALAQRSVRTDFIDAAQLVAEQSPIIIRGIDEARGITGVATGFPDLDRLTRGFQATALTLLAARPSMGKTALALQMAYRIATAGKTVGFFSLEMSRQELFARLTALVSGVDSHRFQGGSLNQTDFGAINDAWYQIAETGFHLDDSPSCNLLDVRGKARRLKARRGGLDLLALDYLQLMDLPRAENRNVAVAEVSRGLKLIARELEVPVLALSQLSRNVEARGGDRKPQLSDLRDSGALEQDADLVLLLHRPEMYKATADNAGVAELSIAKQRNGPVGTVHLVFLKHTGRFESRAAQA